MSVNRGMDEDIYGDINNGIYAMEYYSALKRNEIVPFAEMWMNLEAVIQSEITQKNKYHRLTLTCGTRKNGTNLFAKQK